MAEGTGAASERPARPRVHAPNGRARGRGEYATRRSALTPNPPPRTPVWTPACPSSDVPAKYRCAPYLAFPPPPAADRMTLRDAAPAVGGGGGDCPSALVPAARLHWQDWVAHAPLLPSCRFDHQREAFRFHSPPSSSLASPRRAPCGVRVGNGGRGRGTRVGERVNAWHSWAWVARSSPPCRAGYVPNNSMIVSFSYTRVCF